MFNSSQDFYKYNPTKSMHSGYQLDGVATIHDFNGHFDSYSRISDSRLSNTYKTTSGLSNEDIIVSTNLDNQQNSFTNSQDFILPIRRLSEGGRVHPCIKNDHSISEYKHSSFEFNSYTNKCTKKKACIAGAVLVPIALILIVIIVVPVVITQKNKSEASFQPPGSIFTTAIQLSNESQTLFQTSRITPIFTTSTLPLQTVTGTTIATATTSTCTPNLCLNNGTCIPSNNQGASTCQCPINFTGSFCEKAFVQFKSCKANSCLNGGTCTALDDVNFRCFCSGRFTGNFCEISESLKNDCVNRQPCQNGGTCVLIDMVFPVCFCANGFNGDSCEFKSEFRFF